MKEVEEKVNMLEELFQGFVERVKVLENDVPKNLDAFLKHNSKILTEIYEQIEISNRRYDHSKIQQNIDETRQIMASVPKTIDSKNYHYFGAWSKSLIIAIAISFFLVASSVGIAVHLNSKNNELESEARNFWFVRALYPAVSNTILAKLEGDSHALVELAEQEMFKQKAIIVAQAQAEQAEKQQQAAAENLKKAKSAK